MAGDVSNTGSEALSSERQLQHDEYGFPYHHLPNREFGRLRLGRVFRGGAEYLTYMDHVASDVIAARPASVLDVGCGDGRLLAALAAELGETRRCELVGVDLDDRAVGLANAITPAIDYRVQAIEDVVGSFDVVTCVETLEHIEDAFEQPFLTEVAARVAPGGVLVLTVPSTALPVTAKHHRHYDVESLLDVVGRACPDLAVDRVGETVTHRPWLGQALRLLSNRQYAVDVGVVNEAIARLHARPVAAGRRGLHVMATLRRPGTA